MSETYDAIIGKTVKTIPETRGESISGEVLRWYTKKQEAYFVGDDGNPQHMGSVDEVPYVVLATEISVPASSLTHQPDGTVTFNVVSFREDHTIGPVTKTGVLASTEGDVAKVRVELDVPLMMIDAATVYGDKWLTHH